MAGYMTGYNQVIPVLSPQISTNAAIRYSDYVKLDNYDRVTFFVEVGCISTLMTSAQCTTAPCPVSLYSAYDATGGGASTMGIHTTIGSTGADGTKMVGAAAAVYCMSTLSTHGNTLKINDVTFTFSTVATVTTGTFTTNRYIKLENTPSATGITDTYYHLAAYINHDDYGVTGVQAMYGNVNWSLFSSSSGHVYMWSQGLNSITIQATSSDIIKPVKYIAALETNAAQCAALNTSHKYVCVAITPATQWTISAVAVKSGPRYSPASTYGSYYLYADAIPHSTVD